MSDWYVLRNREPVKDDVNTWSKDRETQENKRVAVDEIGDVIVSTVFLGLDHGHGEGAPLLFETMVFGGAHDGDQWRYSTWPEAEAGHAAAVVLVKQEAWATTPDA